MEETAYSAGSGGPDENSAARSGMPEGGILQHLLEIEARAAVLVDDAQAEADRRIREAEERNRADYDEQYRQLVQELEGEFHRKLEEFRAGYDESLEEYRRGLDTLPLDTGAFSALVSSLLLGEQ
ncbi:MAG: hypothetical protein LBD31_10395 [Treponema sp.]|jgi:vacuolar-type H+-ATPase subunit H|nr:hypothetical protein [Treponema sp.]